MDSRSPPWTRPWARYVVDDGRVAVAEPERCVAFPGVGEAADLVQGGDVVAVVGEEVERAARG